MTTNAYSYAIAEAKGDDMLAYLRDHLVKDHDTSTTLKDVFRGYSQATGRVFELPTKGYVRVCMRMLDVRCVRSWVWRCKLV